MNKVENAIDEIHNIDSMAKRDQWMNELYPLVKLMLTIFYVTLTVSISQNDLGSCLRMAVYPAAVFILGEISVKDSLRRLRVVLPLVCFVGIFNPFFNREPWLETKYFIITAGMVSMAALMLKGVLCVLASYLLIASTTIDKICGALKSLHFPDMIVTQILLMYRYIILLLEEVNRMSQAYSLRAPGQKGIHFKVWGTLTGQLLLRTMDRANEVYDSMCLRGYSGTVFLWERASCRKSDIAYLLIWIGILCILRWI